MSRPPRHARPLRQQALFRLPRKLPQKARHPLPSRWGRYSPPPYSFQMKEPGSEPITVQGFEGWAARGFDSRPRTIESGMTMGEPIRG